MHTYVKNKEDFVYSKKTIFSKEKFIPIFVSIFVILITKWDFDNQFNAAALSIAILVILFTTICALYNINNKTYLIGLIIIGYIEVLNYHHNTLVHSGALAIKVPREYSIIRKTTYQAQREQPYYDNYFKIKELMNLYGITGSYLQKDYCPSLRQDIISKNTQILLELRQKPRHPIFVNSYPPPFGPINYEKQYNAVGDPAYDYPLRKVLGHNHPKVRLTNQAILISNDKTIYDLVEKIDIFLHPTIKITDPLLLSIIQNNPNIPLYTVVNSYFSANKHQFIINNLTTNPLWLIYSDANNKHWRAFIDKHETQIYPANIAFKAVLVAPGVHEITFIYTKNHTIFYLFAVLQIILACCILLIIFYHIKPRA